MSRAISLAGLPKPEPAEVVELRPHGWSDYPEPIRVTMRAETGPFESDLRRMASESAEAWARLAEASQRAGISVAQAAESFRLLGNALRR